MSLTRPGEKIPFGEGMESCAQSSGSLGIGSVGSARGSPERPKARITESSRMMKAASRIVADQPGHRHVNVTEKSRDVDKYVFSTRLGS